MEEKITAWVARDITDDLLLSVSGFRRDGYHNHKLWMSYTTPIRLNKNLFPQVKWEDNEPTKVELTIKICK
jgi:hypothetical protein